MIAAATEDNEPVRITKYTHNPGIHYENLGHVNFYNDEWNLVTYIDLSRYDLSVDQLDFHYELIKKLCEKPSISKYHVGACHRLVRSVNHTLIRIKADKDVVKQLVGRKGDYDNYVRSKRGLFNIIGEGAKMLFGMMDEDDARYYNDQIEKSKKNEAVLLQLVKQQTSIVKSTVHVVNSTIGDIIHNEKLLKMSLDKVNEHINHTTDTLIQALDFYELQNDIEEHVSLLSIMISHYRSELDQLISAILGAQSGVIHPYIITPKRVVMELRKILPFIPKSVTFPLPLSEENGHAIVKVSKINAFVKDSNLVIKIIVPLMRPESFIVYKLTPFPVKVEGDKYLFIQPSVNFLAIDDVKQHYTVLTQNELKECKMTSKNQFVCQQYHPLYLTHMHEICEVKLYHYDRAIPTECDKRIISLEHPLWMQLQSGNMWLFTLPKPESLTISCRSNKKYVKPSDIVLEGSGSLSIDSDCKAYSNSALLIPKNSFSSVVNYEFIPPFDINLDCCEELSKKRNINLTTLKLNTIYKPLMNHVEELNVASHKMTELSKVIDQISMSDYSRHLSYSVLGYVFVTMIILIVIACCIRKCRKFWTPCCNGRYRPPRFNIRVNNSNVARSNEDFAVTYRGGQTVSEPALCSDQLEDIPLTRPRFERISGRKPL